MDFSNERYVRLYVRDTTTWLLLEFEGQTVLMHMLRKATRAGIIDLAGREPWQAPVIHCRIPSDFARRGMDACLREGVIVHEGDSLVFPRYIEANECSQSNAQRVREHRAREREVKQNVTPSSNETLQDDNGEKRGETSGNSVPCRAVPSSLTERELSPFSSANSFAPAREEHDLGQTDRETDKRRGSDFMLQATVLSWQGFDHELALIGAKSEHERATALQAIRADSWCQSNMSRVDPKHVLRKWNSYSSGNKAMQLAKADTSESRKWQSRIQQSTKTLEELRERRSQLQPGSANYAADLYDLDKAIREETERLDRRKRELHALTG